MLLSTYKKYILRVLIPVFIVITFTLTGLIWITQVLKFIHLIDKGTKIYKFVEIISLLLPYLIFTILPIVSVVSVVYVYNNFQLENQIIILKSSGLSNYKIITPVLFLMSVIMVIAMLLSFYIMPYSYNKLKQELSDLKENYFSNVIEVRTFNQISKYNTMYVNKKLSNNVLEGIILFDNKKPDDKVVFFAERGKFIADKSDNIKFILINGMRQSFDDNNNITKLFFDNMTINVSNSSNQTTRERTSLELYIDEMLWPDKKLSENRRKKLITEGHSRIIWSMFNLCFCFLSLSIFLDTKYNRKQHINQFIYSFLPVLISIYCHFTFQKLAYKNLEYILFCYLNVLACIIFPLWKSNKKVI